MPGPGMDLIGEEEITAVVDLLRSGYLLRYSKGDNPRFRARVFTLEQEVARRCQVRHALGMNSGTSALLTALWGLGIGPGDEVIVPGYTFVASISAIIYAGAVPVLAEIDASLNLDPEDVARKISPRTRAIMAVHMLGNPARMAELQALAQAHDLCVIEDCAQAFGASYRSCPLGSLGQVGAFSFNGFKTITAGEGGMLVTGDEVLYRRCFAIHDQGHLPNRTGVEVGARSLIGLDFRLTELQAAVLLAQLGKLDGMLSRLRANKALYKSHLTDLTGLNFRDLPDPGGEIATLLVIFLPDEDIARRVAQELGTKVLADSGWHVYNHMEQILNQAVVVPGLNPFTHPAYLERGGRMEYHAGMLPQTDALLKRALNISIGVFDPGLGSGYGVTVRSEPAEIEASAIRLRRVCELYL